MAQKTEKNIVSFLFFCCCCFYCYLISLFMTFANMAAGTAFAATICNCFGILWQYLVLWTACKPVGCVVSYAKKGFHYVSLACWSTSPDQWQTHKHVQLNVLINCHVSVHLCFFSKGQFDPFALASFFSAQAKFYIAKNLN